MKELIEGFGAQLREALQIAASAQLSPLKNPVHNVVIAGMGGSGIGGNLIQAFTSDSAVVPIVVSKAYDIPAFVGPNTLFLACSFSGNTEETTAAAEKALADGATIVAITSGGKMAEFAQANKLDVISIPGRSGSPRASIGYSFVQLTKVLAHYKLTSNDFAAEYAASATYLDANQAAINAQAQTLAKALVNKLPIFYADSRLEAVVLRTQQQIAENSKQLSHSNVLPEMNHNELVGWDFPRQVFADSVTVLCRTSFDNPRTSKRMDICVDIFRKHSQVIELKAEGASFVEQALHLIHVLDWVSFYLALENGVDPFPVDVITYLKNELAKVN